MPQLDNPRHESFAQAVASGMKGVDAHRKVYGDSKSARQRASLLLTNNDIAQRVSELSGQAATGMVMTLQQEMEYLTRAILTPLDGIDETNILCQRAKYTKAGREIWMVDKLRAMELLARLKKELSQDVANVTISVAPLTPEQILAAVQRSPALQGIGRS